MLGFRLHFLPSKRLYLLTVTGAVCFGLDPAVVILRKSRMTYGVAVLNRFVRGVHPESKLAVKDGVEWCVDVFDFLVRANQSVALGETVVRRYTPAGPAQKLSVFHIYCTESSDVRYVTDPGVRKCGTLCLDMTDGVYCEPAAGVPARREVQARLTFGDTEIKVVALDVTTGKSVRSSIDFLNK